METAFVILPTGETYNYIRTLQVKLSEAFGAQETLKLEPHITIKYAFETTDLKTVENYFAELTSQTKPFDLEIKTVGYFETGVVFLGVTENLLLRTLHLKILRGLKQRFSVEPAEYEGKTFHFHSTLAYKDISGETFQKIKNYLREEKPNLKFTVGQLGLYLRLNSDTNWFIYKVNQLK